MNKYVFCKVSGKIGIDEGETETGRRSIRYLNLYELPLQMDLSEIVYLDSDDIYKMIVKEFELISI